jgi:hypothetical protein
MNLFVLIVLTIALAAGISVSAWFVQLYNLPRWQLIPLGVVLGIGGLLLFGRLLDLLFGRPRDDGANGERKKFRVGRGHRGDRNPPYQMHCTRAMVGFAMAAQPTLRCQI